MAGKLVLEGGANAAVPLHHADSRRRGAKARRPKPGHGQL